MLEAAEIGSGAAGRSTGMVNAGLWVMPSALQETLGPIYGGRMLDLLRDSPRTVFDIVDKHNIQCELKRAGTIHCGAGRKGIAQIAERARQWQALGAPVQILGADETRVKTGTAAFPTSLLDLRAGTIQPLAYVRGLAEAAIASGVRLFTASPVDNIAREGNDWRLGTEGGSVRAKWVVISTDVYTSGIIPELRHGQVVLPFFHFATAPLKPNIRRTILPDGHGAWDTRTPMTAFRTDDAGRLIVGSVGALRGTGTTVHRNWARRAVCERSSRSSARLNSSTSGNGRIGMTTICPPSRASGENDCPDRVQRTRHRSRHGFRS